jgi:endonuclease/exonuclease/phosphatase (EEP) superfamily protein YafD
MDGLEAVGRAVVVFAGAWVVSGTLLNLSRHPHWYIRGWDFPRPVVAAVCVVSGIAYAAWIARGAWFDLLFLGALALTFTWQLVNIRPYTRLGRRVVEPARRPAGPHAFRLLIANVLQENREHQRLLAVIAREDPDVVLLVEVDHAWARALQPLEGAYPHRVLRVLDNYYGMALYSRLRLHDPEVAFLVQDDIPSIHARLELRDGVHVWLHALHPRPPEPLRGQDSAPRDAELLKVARRIRERSDVPAVVAGDLNDVAWSHTTALFLKESRLLDPRLGRGSFNSYNAKNPLFRFPLDHVFHSRHFRLVELRRLEKVGSDHFPMLVALSHEPDAAVAQQPAPATPNERQEADELIRRADEGERPDPTPVDA